MPASVDDLNFFLPAYSYPCPCDSSGYGYGSDLPAGWNGLLDRALLADGWVNATPTRLSDLDASTGGYLSIVVASVRLCDLPLLVFAVAVLGPT